LRDSIRIRKRKQTTSETRHIRGRVALSGRVADLPSQPIRFRPNAAHHVAVELRSGRERRAVILMRL
jgi:hypothetical protein